MKDYIYQEMAEMAISTEAKMLESEAVSWFQTKEDIHVRYFVPKGTKKAQVKVVMKKSKLFLSIYLLVPQSLLR